MEILGLPWSEGELLDIVSLAEELTHVRRMPGFANGSVEVGVYERVPDVKANNENIPKVYPVSAL